MIPLPEALRFGPDGLVRRRALVRRAERPAGLAGGEIPARLPDGE